MFPAGAPGIALLILRNCIAFSLAGCAFSAGWQHFVFLSLLSLLCIGLLTPAVCGLAALTVVVEFASLKQLPTANVVVIILSTFALALLGPGAISVDSKLFGRRIVVSTSPAANSPSGIEGRRK